MRIFHGLLICFALMSAPMTAMAGGAEIKALYSDYKTALAAKNYPQAFITAEKTWQAAETEYGDSKVSGDFAYNYAVLGTVLTKQKRNKKIEKAFERAIELAPLHGDKSAAVLLKRHVKFANYYTKIGRKKNAAVLLTKADGIARRAGLTDGKDYATLLYTQAKSAFQSRKYKQAGPLIDQAVTLFGELGRIESKIGYDALYMKARTDTKLGNTLTALLGYEKIFVNKDRSIPMTDQIIGRAFIQFKNIRRELPKQDKEALDSARTCAGCWPNILPKFMPYLDNDDGFYYKQRKPPVMPRSAKSSGFVVIMFDFGPDGAPTNMRLVGGSHVKTFDYASQNSLSAWRAFDNETDAPITNRKDIITAMWFMLSDGRGHIMDYYGASMPN